MERLEPKHIAFLRQCAAKPNAIHALPMEIIHADADEMADQGLLIKYNRIPVKYAIAKYGAQLAKTYGAADTPEMIKIAVEYVISKGYSAEAAEGIVKEHGCVTILSSKAEDQAASSQREVKPPTDSNGNVAIKFKG